MAGVELIHALKEIGISDNDGEATIKTRKTHDKKNFYRIAKRLLGLLIKEVENLKK